MKLKLLNLFQDLELNDNEKVFMYFVTWILQQNGFHEHYMMHTMDVKVLMKANPVGAHITHGSVSPEIKKYLQFAIYSDKKVGFNLTDTAKAWLKNNGNSSYCGTFYANIEDEIAIRVYLYILGALAHSENLVEEVSGMGNSRYEDLVNRKIDRIELSSLLNVTELDQ